ncbi:MAG: type II toxin-antitoxin system death-on-curing family toxin [Gammaproteobacteria bacterium]|nr:type II toxin-antitoxin system death-on-curing family toxin [Gammaproteobacteria bacterium]
MKEPRWIPAAAIRAIHAELIAEHGGLSGAVDEALLDAALNRPRHLYAYEDPSLPRLAAAYAFGFTGNHPFKDGNKRVALAAIDVFLRLNGRQLTAAEALAAAVIERLAAGQVTEAALTGWIEAHSRLLQPPYPRPAS